MQPLVLTVAGRALIGLQTGDILVSGIRTAGENSGLDGKEMRSGLLSSKQRAKGGPKLFQAARDRINFSFPVWCGVRVDLDFLNCCITFCARNPSRTILSAVRR